MQLLMRRPELEGFIAISPLLIGMILILAPCPVSGLIVQGTKDDIVSHGSVESFVQKLRNQKGIKIDFESIQDSDHFLQTICLC